MNGTENNGLSDRELEVLHLVATGASNKEIALALSISQNTVKVHLRNIFSKTGATSRTEAAMYAVRLGLVKTPAAEETPFACWNWDGRAFLWPRSAWFSLCQRNPVILDKSPGPNRFSGHDPPARWLGRVSAPE